MTAKGSKRYCASLGCRERSVTLTAPSLQNISDHSSEISLRQQMLIFKGPVHGYPDRPVNDPFRTPRATDLAQIIAMRTKLPSTDKVFFFPLAMWASIA